MCDRGDLRGRYELFAVGSDQIWNYDYGLAPWHFLDFAGPRARITLSPSVGHESIPNEWRPFYARHLSLFDEVGVREDDWARSLPPDSNYTTPTITRLIDPTLVFPNEFWRKYSRAAEHVGGVLVYSLGDLGASEWELVNAVAVRNHLDVHHVSGAVQGSLWETNAAEFLGMVDTADVVVTDSYHGAIFAFLFEKPVVVLRRSGIAGSMNSRIDTLVSNLHLSDRLSDVVRPEDVMNVDYSDGQEALERLRAEFWAYLSRQGLGPDGPAAVEVTK